VLENVRALEQAGIEGLRDVEARYASIGDVRAVGCFLAIEFVRDRVTKERDLELQEEVARGCIRRGLLVDASTTSLNIVTKGSLVLDALLPGKTDQRRVVWRGIADSTVEDTDSDQVRQNRLQTAAAELVKRFPLTKLKK